MFFYTRHFKLPKVTNFYILQKINIKLFLNNKTIYIFVS
jgi:hypothetical protein